MTPTPPLRLRWATHSDRGLVREHQQDALRAGEGLLGVADGFGPRTGTGSTALDALAGAVTAPGAIVDVLRTAAEHAAAAVRDAAGGTASGTTLTALVWTGSDVALVHVGDSRAYLLRDGELLRLTHDHTVTQRMVDAGELTEAEAATHPQRSILVRALADGAADPPDVSAQRVRVGDRYLLCTDGLHAPVPEAAIRAGLRDHAEPDGAVTALAALVRSVGAPDNTALVVADVLAA
jgi:protein phosphatase